jgi:two-component system phosphate regulon sensor histidine kinase PhoR
MFENRRIRLRTTALYAAGIALAALLLYLIVIWLVRGALLRNTQEILRTQAVLTVANPDLVDAWQAGDSATLHAFLLQWAGDAGGELIGFDTSGQVVARSLPEDAPSQYEGRAQTSDGVPIVTIAAPVADGDTPLGYLRWTLPLDGYAQRFNTLAWQLGLAVGLAALLAIVMMFLEVERSAHIIRRVTTRLERAANHDFDGHVLTITPGELGALAASTNRLVDRYRKASKRRAREKDRLTTVLTQMSSGALILNETGMVRIINPAAATMLQVSPDEATKYSFVQVVKDHRIAEVWQRSRSGNREESETLELGPNRSMQITVTPFLGGDANGHLVIMQDLTAMRRLEKVRQDFVSNVSHELRTPLASITALAEVLKDGALEDPPAARRFLDSMQIEVDKMAQMVEELLHLSRIESGKLPLQLQQSEVRMLVQPAVDRLATQAERAGIALSAVVADGLPTVTVDAERVQQVLINLMHNAIKFTPEGGTVVVEVAAPAAGATFVKILVRDTGPGIPANEQARIFERFYKTDRSRASGGTGLGLAIAKHIVHLHGGEIGVQSREGHGSTFWFTLPVAFPAVELTTATIQKEIDADEQDSD